MVPKQKLQRTTANTGSAAKRSGEALVSLVPKVDIVSNNEVIPHRKRFHTIDYKLKILKEIDNCPNGEIGSILRREGIYSSNIRTWRKQLQKGIKNAFSQRGGRKAKIINPLETEVERLQKENFKLCLKLKQAEIIIEAQKKISELFQLPIQSQREVE